MKKSIALLLFIHALTFAAHAQRTFPLRFELDSLPFSLTVENSQLFLKQQGISSLFDTKSDYPVVLGASLEDGDLVIRYKEKDAGGMLSYTIGLQLKLPNGQVLSPAENELSNTFESVSVRKITWMNALAFLEDFEAVHTLYVTRSLMGAVNCDAPRPAMRVQLRAVSYIGTTVGGGFIVIGSVYRQEKKEAYQQYERLWREGGSKPDLLNSPLETARKNDRNARIFTWTGIGIIAANAAVFNIIGYKIKKKQKYYDKFCNPENKTSFHLSPSKSGIGIALNF